MYIKNVLFSAIIIQICVCIVDARTNEDVIEDFKRTFDDRHNTFSNFEKLVAENVPQVLDNMQQLINLEKNNVEKILENNIGYINNTLWTIIEEAGLIGSPELVEPCSQAVFKQAAVLDDQAIGSARVCVDFALEELNETKTFVQTLNSQLQGEHYMLNVTREECVKYGSSYDVQECLINDLYIFYIPYIKDVTLEINNRIEKIQQQQNTLEKNLSKCDSILQNHIKQDTDAIVTDARKCISEIKH